MLVLFLRTAPVQAQDPAASAPAPDTRRDQEARSLFDAGRLAFEDGRFEEALAAFERAYQLSQRSGLLYNIGTAAERLHHYDRAIEAFEQYLEANPTITNHGEVARRLELLREIPTQTQTPTPPPEEHEEDAPPPTEADAPPPTSRDEGSSFPVGTVIAGSAAVVMAGLSIFFWADANSAYDDLESTCGRERECTQAQVDDSGGPTSVTLTNVFLVGSIAAVAATAVLAYVELGTSDDEEGAQVGIGPGNVQLRGRF